MILSDAKTRGPWRKRWLNYIRNQDILETMEDRLGTCSDPHYDILSQAINVQLRIMRDLREEIRKALSVGDAHQKVVSPGVLLPGSPRVDQDPLLQLSEGQPKEELRIDEVRLFRQLFPRPESGDGDSEKLGEPPPSRTVEQSRRPLSGPGAKTE